MVRRMLKNQTLTKVFCIATLFTFITTLYTPRVFCFSKADAEYAIQNAERGLLECYNTVFEAEKAGANVGDLLKVLNEASWLLSKANHAYNSGDFNEAYEYALNCIQKLERIEDQAHLLKMEAEKAGLMDFLVNYVGSAIGSVAVIIGGYIAWVFIKKRGNL